MAASVYSANLLLNFLLRGVTGTTPSAWYVALFNGDPAGTGTEVSAGDYARVAVTFAAPLNAVCRNSNEIDFGTLTEDWGDVTHFAVYDALTGGNMLTYDPFEDATTLEIDAVVKIAAGVVEVILE